MAISMFSSQASPIAIDFGTSSVKLLQVAPGDPPALLAAAEIEIPDELRGDSAKRFEFLNDALPTVIRKGRFKGRRATCSIPSSRTFVQHIQVPTGGGVKPEDFINTQLHIQTGVTPSNLVIRTVNVAELVREDGTKAETICFAVPRDVVMKQIDLLKKCRLEVGGVHTEQHAMVWAYQHLHAVEDDLTTLYVDVGWGSTKVGIGHGGDLVFSKSIRISGQHFDKETASSMDGDAPTARAHRIASIESRMNAAQEAAGAAATATATAPPAAPAADDRPFVDAVVEELRMCVRYHRSMFSDRRIDRVIFLGGECRDADLCRTIAAAVEAPGHIGDPLARLRTDEAPAKCGVDLGRMQPGWGVVCGLCIGPDQ